MIKEYNKLLVFLKESNKKGSEHSNQILIKNIHLINSFISLVINMSLKIKVVKYVFNLKIQKLIH